MSLEATSSSKAAGAAGACPSAVMHVYKPAIVMLFGVLGMLAVRDEDIIAKTHPGVRNAKKSSTTYAKIVLEILPGLPNDRPITVRDAHDLEQVGGFSTGSRKKLVAFIESGGELTAAEAVAAGK